MTGTRTVAAVLALTLLAGLAGCRKASPNAPKHAVDGALANIGLYCGEATALETFGGHERRISQLDSAASTAAHHLIEIMKRNPQATYLGQSMLKVVDGTASATQECRLTQTSKRLSAALRSAR